VATATMYTNGMAAFANKELDWDTDNFSALLLKDTYTINQNTHEFVTDVISGNELSGGSYVRVALAGKTISEATGVVKLLADDIIFAPLTATDVLYMVVFRNTGSDATSKLICVVQFDAEINPTAQSVTFNLSTDGLINFSLA
jgi:PKD repeat protein